MLRSKSRDRELSKTLRKLVCESIELEKQRVPRDRNDTGTDKREVFNKSEDIGKGISEFQSKTKHSWQEHGAVLEPGENKMLAAILLERMQSFATAALQEPIHNE